MHSILNSPFENYEIRETFDFICARARAAVFTAASLQWRCLTLDGIINLTHCVVIQREDTGTLTCNHYQELHQFHRTMYSRARLNLLPQRMKSSPKLELSGEPRASEGARVNSAKYNWRAIKIRSLASIQTIRTIPGAARRREEDDHGFV